MHLSYGPKIPMKTPMKSRHLLLPWARPKNKIIPGIQLVGIPGIDDIQYGNNI
jgi:hypothetical protein